MKTRKCVVRTDRGGDQATVCYILHETVSGSAVVQTDKQLLVYGTDEYYSNRSQLPAMHIHRLSEVRNYKLIEEEVIQVSGKPPKVHPSIPYLSTPELAARLDQ
jgi:hypothetical protein